MNNFKKYGVYKWSAHQMNVLLSDIFLFLVRAACELRLTSYCPKQHRGGFPIHHCVCNYMHNSKTKGRIRTFYPYNNCNTIGVEVIWKVELSFGYLQILKLIFRLCDSYSVCVTHIFSFSHSCFILFHFCQGLISVNSVRQVWVSWLCNENPPLQKSSSYHLNPVA